MADTLSRIFGPQTIASGTTTLFTGTVGHTYTYKNIRVVNNGGSTITLKLGIGGVTDPLLFLPAEAIGPGESIEFDGLLVTSGTETVQANADASGLTITASGLDQTNVGTGGGTELVYAYTVVGSDKASIDTGVDAADAGSGVWTNGDVLEVYTYLRTDEASVFSSIDMTLNNDTSSIYDRVYVQGNNATAAANNVRSAANWQLTAAAGASNGSGHFCSSNFSMPDYLGTVGNKVFNAIVGMPDGSLAANMLTISYSLGYRSTSAISRLKIVPDTSGKLLKVGSQLLVYKRKRVN